MRKKNLALIQTLLVRVPLICSSFSARMVTLVGVRQTSTSSAEFIWNRRIKCEPASRFAHFDSAPQHFIFRLDPVLVIVSVLPPEF